MEAVQYFCRSKNIRLKQFTAVVLLFFFFTAAAVAQTPTDSLIQLRADSLKKAQEAKELAARQDSLKKAEIENARLADSTRKVLEERKRKEMIAGVTEMLGNHPFYAFDGKPVRLIISVRDARSNDGLFYFVLALILYFALIRLFFYKYLSTLFTVFFRASLRQQQLREQLLQAPLPALLLNIFFLVNAGAYLAFLSHHYQFSFAQNFWSTATYCVIFVAVIYIIKYMLLKIAGWIFGITPVTDTYIFIVFLINKMVGMFLLPVLALMAFPNAVLFPIALILSYVVIGFLFLYRFLISYRPVRNEIKLNRLHFFLYLCAFEVAPLLLIYKVLLSFLISSY